MQQIFNFFIDWLSHSSWPCAAIGGLIFLESSPVIGLLIPGVILIPAIGTITGNGLLDFWSVYLCAASGALIIDSIGYWLGRAGYTQWQHRLSGHRSEVLQQRIHQLFRRFGPFALFSGRIMLLIHPMVPISAGMLGVGILTFYLIDTVAVLLWLLIYLSGGHWLSILWLNINIQSQLALIMTAIAGALLWRKHAQHD